jgi:ABC-type antimicrobial peptide transport system permease subunit
MLILATALANLDHDPPNRKIYTLAALLFLIGGVVLNYLSPISKHRVSVAYVLVTLGASGILFWLIHLLVEKYGIKMPLLAAWGKTRYYYTYYIM